jgi:hypothetical protein
MDVHIFCTAKITPFFISALPDSLPLVCFPMCHRFAKIKFGFELQFELWINVVVVVVAILAPLHCCCYIIAGCPKSVVPDNRPTYHGYLVKITF